MTEEPGPPTSPTSRPPSSTPAPPVPVVRRLGPDEWETLREVRLRALATDPRAFIATHAEEAAFDDDTWRARMAAGQFAAVAADGRALATAALVTAGDDPARRDVVGVWVDPVARGLGLGRELLAAVLELAREQDVVEVGLWVLGSNVTAIALYERTGFTFDGTRTRLPGWDEDDLRMVIRLAPGSDAAEQQ